jgi:hypothetical protein
MRSLLENLKINIKHLNKILYARLKDKTKLIIFVESPCIYNKYLTPMNSLYKHTLYYIKIYEINNIKRRRLRYLNILHYNILLYYTVV